MGVRPDGEGALVRSFLAGGPPMGRWPRIAFVLGLLIWFISGSSAGHSQEALSVQINSVDLSAFPVVRATVTVLDDTQRPVAGLPAESFEATADGEALPLQSLTSATDAGVGIGVVLAFDTSGSMEGAPLAAAREAGKTLTANLGGSDQVAVVSFASNVRRVLSFTQDRQAAATAIDTLFAAGNTALYQGVADSAEAARGGPLPRRAVILLSDGTDFGGVSRVDAPMSLAAAGGSGVPFFVIGLGDAIDQEYLEQLASATRGQFLLAPTPEALAGLYENVGSILRHQYIVTLDASPVALGAAAVLRIAVTAGGATGAAETELKVPAGSPPPTQQPVVTPVPTSVVQGTEGGSNLAPVIVAGGVGGVATLGVAGFFFWRRRRRVVQAEVDLRRIVDKSPPPAYPVIETVAPMQSNAYLRVAGDEGGEVYPLGDWPVTVGFTSDCNVRLPDGATTGWERVRIWRREGRYMLHNLSRMGMVQVGGKAATWVVLDDGDEVQIGAARLVFHDKPPEQSSG